jgi:hypothetical protein
MRRSDTHLRALLVRYMLLLVPRDILRLIMAPDGAWPMLFAALDTPDWP